MGYYEWILVWNQRGKFKYFKTEFGEEDELCFNWFWRRVFQSFNFVSPKQEACVWHIQQNSVKHNIKNNTGVQSVIV